MTVRDHAGDPVTAHDVLDTDEGAEWLAQRRRAPRSRQRTYGGGGPGLPAYLTDGEAVDDDRAWERGEGDE